MKKIFFLASTIIPLLAFPQKKIGNRIGLLLNIKDTSVLYSNKWQVTNIISKQKSKIRFVDSMVVNDSIFYDFNSQKLSVTQSDYVENYKLKIYIDTLDGARSISFGMYPQYHHLRMFPENKHPDKFMSMLIIYLSNEVCVLNIYCVQKTNGYKSRFCKTIVLQPIR